MVYDISVFVKSTTEINEQAFIDTQWLFYWAKWRQRCLRLRITNYNRPAI